MDEANETEGARGCVPTPEQVAEIVKALTKPNEKTTPICALTEEELKECVQMDELAKETSVAYAIMLEKISILQALRKGFWERASLRHGFRGKNIRVDVETKQYLLVETVQQNAKNN